MLPSRKRVPGLLAGFLALALSAAPLRGADRESPARLFPEETLVLAYVNASTADLSADYAAACPRAVSSTPASAFASLVVGLLGPLAPVDAPPFNRPKFYRDLGPGLSGRKRKDRLYEALQRHRIATRRKLHAAASRDRAALAGELASFLEGARLWAALLVAPPRRVRWALVVRRAAGDGPERFRSLLASCRVCTRPVPGLEAVSFRGAPAWRRSLPTDPKNGGPSHRPDEGRDPTAYAGFHGDLVLLTDHRATLEDLLARAARPSDRGALALGDVAELEGLREEARAYVYAHLPRLLASVDRGLSRDAGLSFLRMDVLLELFRARSLRLLSLRSGTDVLRLSAPGHIMLSEGRDGPMPMRTAAAFPSGAAVAASLAVKDLPRTWERIRGQLAAGDRALYRDRAGPNQAGGPSPFERHLRSVEGDLGVSLAELAALCTPEIGFFAMPLLSRASPWNFALVLPLRKGASTDPLVQGLRKVERTHGAARGLQFRQSRCASHPIAMLTRDTARRGLERDCRTALKEDEAGLFVLDLGGMAVISPRFGTVMRAAETWNRRAAAAAPSGPLVLQIDPTALWRYLFRDELIDPAEEARPYTWAGKVDGEGLVLTARNAVLPMALSLLAGLDGHLRYRELARLDEDRFELIRTAFETFARKTGRLPGTLAELLEGLDLRAPPSWLFHPADPRGASPAQTSVSQALGRSTLLYKVPSFAASPAIRHRPCLADRAPSLRNHHVFLYVARSRRGTYTFYWNTLTDGSDRRTLGGR